MIAETPRTRRIVLIGGGVRSGKSRFALSRAQQSPGRRGFIATAQARDDEMRERIRAHVAERGQDFETIEEPLELTHRLSDESGFDILVVDCLTLWLSNRLLRDHDANLVREATNELVAVLAKSSQTVIIVTNEVGMGVVPDSALGRVFRDVAGNANQRLALAAEEVYLAAMGVVVRLRPQPLVVVA